MPYEEEFDRFLEQQKRTASGQRLEMLNADKSGEKKLFCEVLKHVLPSLDGLVMEYEIVSTSGVKIYIDFFYVPLRIAFECEGKAVHADTVTRERFSFERKRIRSLAKFDFTFVPYSRDELDRSPDSCRRDAYEILGRCANADAANQTLSLFERLLLYFAVRLNRPFHMSDVCGWLEASKDLARQIIRGLIDRNWIRPVSKGRQRHHAYEVVDPDACYRVRL